MKKVLCKVLAVTLAAMMLLCTTAFAAEIGSAPGEGNKITVNVTGLQEGDECTLLVVLAGTGLAGLESQVDKIYYIDQVTSQGGTATFDFAVESGINVDIYSGYTSMGEQSPLELLAKVEEDIVYGDVNGDGVVNAKDRTLLTRFVGGWDGVTIDEAAADVNKDGSVNAKDRTILTRHVGGWVGYEALPYGVN